ncbi:MAG: hypothetical protein ABW166_05165 [Sedimenticola sp.]
MKRDSLDRRRAVYERLVKGSPGDPLYLSNLGYVYLYLDMQQLAGDQFHQTLAIEPNQPLAQSGLARLGLPEQ